jgi:voltage-gated potassium channel Kch
VVGYAEIYFNLSLSHAISFSHPLDWSTSIYFSLVTFATVGYGDISPADGRSRILVSTEIVVSLFSLAILLATSVSWILTRRQELAARRAEERESDTQYRERTLKEAGLGLYSTDAEFHAAVLKKVAEIRQSRGMSNGVIERTNSSD